MTEPTWNNHDPDDCRYGWWTDCEGCWMTYKFRKFMEEN